MGRWWLVPMLVGAAAIVAGAAETATRPYPPCNDTGQCIAPGLPGLVWFGVIIFLMGLILLGRDSSLESEQSARTPAGRRP